MRYVGSVLVLLWGIASTAQAAAPLSLFGVNLKDAERTTLRQAIKQAGVKVEREDDRFWHDVYDPKAVLDGSSKLTVGYEDKTGRFAVAAYTFPAFVDPGKVSEVVDMVSRKYGKPSEIVGSYQIGAVTATWQLEKGMGIEVSRGWPNTTVTLKYFDRARFVQLQKEIRAQEEQDRNSKAKEQSKAY